ncbi:MAG TPA: FMN-binding protein [Jatrophihabitans sp.]|jgi:uncharacterized protein with FMN-binding domain
MKRVLAALFGTVTGLIFLLDFKSHPASVASVPVATSPVQPGTSSSSSTGSSSPASSNRTSSGTAKRARTASYTGDSVDTQYGPVQVRITVSGGKVTAAQAVVYPTEDPRDQQINAYAIPTLNQEAVAAARSAQIDMVSGATYTSDGYIQSLQSALDKAGL